MSWVLDLDTGEFSKGGKVFCHTERYNIPAGTYSIGYARHEPLMGEAVMRLTQYHEGFPVNVGAIAGDVFTDNNIVLPRIVRLRIATSEDRLLDVVSD